MSYYSSKRNGDIRLSRKEWNSVIGLIAFFIAIIFSLILFSSIGEKICYQKEEAFVSCDDTTIVTNMETYKRYKGNSIIVDSLETNVKNGDTIVLTISRFTGNVMEISANDDTVYQTKQTSWKEIIYNIVILIVLGALIAVFLYSINAKNPPIPFSIIKSFFIVEKKARTPRHSDNY